MMIEGTGALYRSDLIRPIYLERVIDSVHVSKSRWRSESSKRLSLQRRKRLGVLHPRGRINGLEKASSAPSLVSALLTAYLHPDATQARHLKDLPKVPAKQSC